MNGNMSFQMGVKFAAFSIRVEFSRCMACIYMLRYQKCTTISAKIY